MAMHWVAAAGAVMAMATVLAAGAVPAGNGQGRKLPRLKVSENRRFLVKEDASPFFYLGDTAWELFHRLNREEADRYLENRAAKGFSIIQAVAATGSKRSGRGLPTAPVSHIPSCPHCGGAGATREPRRESPQCLG